MIRKITLAAISMFLLTSLTACSKKDETPKSSVDSSEVENNTDENKEDTSSVSSSKGDLELTSYQMQSVVSSINNKLSQMYEIGTYEEILRQLYDDAPQVSGGKELQSVRQS